MERIILKKIIGAKNKFGQGFRYELKCSNCKKAFIIEGYRFDRGEGKFCSQKCHHLFRKKFQYGFRKKKGILLNCKICGKKFYVIQSRIKKAKYCSSKCYWKNLEGKHLSPNTEFTSEKTSGKRNLFYGKKHSKKKRKEISRKTRGKPKPNLKGSKNAMWNNGSSFEPYGYEFNDSLKEQCRNLYFNYCQLCGIVQECLSKKLQTHHIDYNKRNNTLKNLIPLCSSCHTKTNSNRKYWTEFFKKKTLI